MDWNLVRLFVEVVEAGSMSEAARRRGITRSGVSQRLRQLEQQVKAQLLRRTTRNLKPTEIGRTLYEHGKQIALQFEAACHDVESLGKTLSGIVRVSVPPGIGHTHLTPALLTFAEAHPALALNVTFNNRLSDMIQADVDIALRIMKSAPEDLIAQELRNVHWYLYCTPRYLSDLGQCEQPEDLQRAAFLSTMGSRRVELALVSSRETTTVTLTSRFVSESVAFLRACMLAHMGVAMLPQHVVRDLLGTGQVVRVLPKFTCADYDSKIFILTAPNRFPTPAMKAVMDVLHDTVLHAIEPDP